MASASSGAVEGHSGSAAVGAQAFTGIRHLPDGQTLHCYTFLSSQGLVQAGQQQLQATRDLWQPVAAEGAGGASRVSAAGFTEGDSALLSIEGRHVNVARVTVGEVHEV